MLLGKRQRRQIKRAPSLRDLSLETAAPECFQPPEEESRLRRLQRTALGVEGAASMSSYNSITCARPPQQQREEASDLVRSTGSVVIPTAPPRKPRRHSADFALQPAPFLTACALCKRRLGPGRDTFMYRDEAAFCSLECRLQQMNLDETKGKRPVAASIRRRVDPVQSQQTNQAETKEKRLVAEASMGRRGAVQSASLSETSGNRETVAT